MATQPAAPASGNGGGNHLGLTIGGKTLSLQSQQLALVLFILCVAVLAWYRAQTLATHLDRVQATQTQLLDAIHTGDATLEAVLRDQIHTLREALLTRQVAIQEASSEERAALSQALAAHGQQTQGQAGVIQQCVEQVQSVLQVLRQRGVGP